MWERIRDWWYELSWDLRAGVVVLSLASLAVAGVFSVRLLQTSPSESVSTYTQAVGSFQDYVPETVTVR
jgi:hypothetical protein